MQIFSSAVLPFMLAALAGCALPIVSEPDIEIQARAQFEKMRTTMEVSTDSGVIRYVNCVTREIVGQLDEPYASKNWEVVVFEDEAANAFALPGGKIGVFTGLLEVTENQDQLAAVIGHEVAHVTGQHAVERVNRELTTRVGLIGATAALGGSQGTYDLMRIGARLGLSLPYGRGQEREADITGLNLMAAAGFDPRASVQLWKNMGKAREGRPPEFLSTHPSSGSRIDELITAMPRAIARYNRARAAGGQPRCGP